MPRGSARRKNYRPRHGTVRRALAYRKDVARRVHRLPDELRDKIRRLIHNGPTWPVATWNSRRARSFGGPRRYIRRGLGNKGRRPHFGIRNGANFPVGGGFYRRHA